MNITLTMTEQEAIDLASIARAYATQERADAEGKMHNAAMSRIASAERFEELAERMEAVAFEQQNRRSAAEAARMSRFVRGRQDRAAGGCQS
jgi:hypothetical protein